MATGKAWATKNSVVGTELIPIEDCWIDIPNYKKIVMRALPEITDSKQATYNNEPIIGRSFPLYTYSHSNDRQIHMQIHFYVINEKDAADNLADLRAIQSAVYPREGTGGGSPFIPPPICQIKCGQILALQPLCVVLQSYSVKFPTEVIWDEKTFCPFKFDVDTNWWVVYTSSDLPFQSRIISSGR
jgi:hypothetical protein